MIDVDILGISLRSICHVFLKVLPNFAVNAKNRIFGSLEKVVSARS